jgi:hypothetical protein
VDAFSPTGRSDLVTSIVAIPLLLSSYGEYRRSLPDLETAVGEAVDVVRESDEEEHDH